MTDFLDGLERDLVDAARRRAGAAAPARSRRRRPPLRSGLLAAALLVVTAGSAAGGTLLALRGSVIPAPQAVPREQTPAPGTSRVEALRAPDPQPGVPPWTLRVARSETGLLCSTVGQVSRDGRFGLVGLDGRFRTIAEGVSDSCGSVHSSGASLIGARIFDADARRDVRTVVSGVVASDVRRVDVTAGTRTFRVTVEDGAFALALRGYPEDLGIRATLTLASGRREVHDFGRGPNVAVDPLGGPAWKATAISVAGDGPPCISFSWARAAAGAPRSPAACGELGVRPHRHGFYVAVRRLARGPRDARSTSPLDGPWGDHPPRTAVYGQAAEDVRSLALQIGTAAPRPLAISPYRAFLAVLDPKVDPRTIRLHVRFADGRTVVTHGSANLVAPDPHAIVLRTP
jgi:hypothetical protein